MDQHDETGELPNRESPPRQTPAGSRQTRRRLLAVLGAAGLTAAGVGAARALGLAGAGPARRAHTRSPATPQPTSAPHPTATAATRPVSIVITGDVMLARTVNDQMVASHDQFPFNNTASLLKSFDVTVGNLECVVSTLGSAIPGKQFTFEANPIGFQRLADAGYDIVSVANNHSGDFGKDAFVDMITNLPVNGITPLGGGISHAQAHLPVVRHVHATTLGFLAYCEIGPEDFAATESVPGHAWLTIDALSADIAYARPLCDFLIVFTHWGVEYEVVETGHQQDLAHAAVDAGADLVVGCHPHVIQPSETYKGKLIVYSLGNFVFDYMTAPLTSACNVLTLQVQGATLLDWKLVHATIGDWGQPAWG